MGKTQYYTATTLDGFIATEDHSLDWLFAVEGGDSAESGDSEFPAFFAQIGAMAMGASTFEWVVRHENLLEHPEKWGQWYGETPTWVFAHRELPRVDVPTIRVVQGDVRPLHAEMTQAAGDRNIWIVGGGELVGQFADAHLLDEIVASVAPATLGRGAPLLPRALTPQQLRLTDVRRTGQFARLTYSVSTRATRG